MPTIAPGVDFTVTAREWRCKWSADSDKASLVALQETINKYLDQVKAVDGCQGVQRVVCGDCLDYKIITSVAADKFGDWEAKQFEPEGDVLKAMSEIPGVTSVETQTFTLAPMWLPTQQPKTTCCLVL
mmetsp:Transcript_89714/g.172709  ORF Transcript_89714/g.172709 Transcript_89714/m.172709 type:complete len:128 (-) Transcript_89714:68-451(-)